MTEYEIVVQDGVRKKRFHDGKKYRCQPLCVGKDNTCEKTSKKVGGMCNECGVGKRVAVPIEDRDKITIDKDGRRVIYVNDHKRYYCMGQDNTCMVQSRTGKYCGGCK